MDRIYLDHNASSPVLPEVAQAMADCLAGGYANPASPHAEGRRARRRLEEVRETIAVRLGADVESHRPDRLIFTSGGTEANNLALFGLAGGRPGRILFSAVEHPSVSEAANVLSRRGWHIESLRVDADGVVDLDHLSDLLDDDVRLVSIMLANHETGVLQPVAQAAALCAAAGVLLHTDAAQVAGKLEVDFRGLGVAALSFASHKFHGPPGVGGLLVDRDVTLSPVLYGGFQQHGWRPGTESVALAVGTQRALGLWDQEAGLYPQRLGSLRDDFEKRLSAAFAELIVNGGGAARTPQTSNLSFPGCDRQALLMALDLAGVACSTGAACASGSRERSPTLAAMGCSEEVWGSALRFSLGMRTTSAEVADSAARIARIAKELRGKSRLGNSLSSPPRDVSNSV